MLIKFTRVSCVTPKFDIFFLHNVTEYVIALMKAKNNIC